MSLLLDWRRRFDTPAPDHLEMKTRLDQARLGRPLDAEAFEHAVREAAWDHELDATQVAPLVLRAVEELFWSPVPGA